MTVTALIVVWILMQSVIAIASARGRLALRIWGMHLSHLGFAALILGIAVTTYYSIEDDVVLSIGDTHTMGDYAFTLESVSPINGPNYTSARANLSVAHHGKFLTLMQPEKRFYTERNMPIAQIALEGNLARDLYVALAEPLRNNQWILRIQYKPMVRFIWLGAIMIALGGIFAVFDGKIRPLFKGGRRVLTSGVFKFSTKRGTQS
jgi:cytochrome c-type biogenesis protein CcmF